MSTDELTIGQAKELLAMFPGQPPSAVTNTTPTDAHRYKIGEHYFIRTVTYFAVGKLVAVTDKELWIVNASWVADTGGFHDALNTGELNEVEPFPASEEIAVGRGALIDACRWLHDLPTEQK